MATEAGRSESRRTQALALLRDESLSIAAIAERVGVPRQAVERWNARAGIRPPQPRRRTLEAWPQRRREAAARLLAVGDVDPGDLAEAFGFARTGAALLLSTFGSVEGTNLRDGIAMSPRRLRARLRAHVGRQIAALDAALSDMPKLGVDSARILRDLGGLKRILDDLDTGREGEGEPHDEPNPTMFRGRDPDLLREEIARRFARFVEGGAAG